MKNQTIHMVWVHSLICLKNKYNDNNYNRTIRNILIKITAQFNILKQFHKSFDRLLRTLHGKATVASVQTSMIMCSEPLSILHSLYKLYDKLL